MRRDTCGFLKDSPQETTCNTASSDTENKTLFKETIADPKKIIDHTNAATQTNFYMKKQEVKRLEQTRETFINVISRLSIAFENLENILQPVFDSLSQENAISQQKCDTIKQLRKIAPRLRRRKFPWDD